VVHRAQHRSRRLPASQPPVRLATLQHMSPAQTDDPPSESQWRAWRALFPALERCVYLNTAAFGPVSVPAAQAARQYYEDWSSQYGDLAASDVKSAVDRARESVARLLGASAREIAFIPNTSTAMSCAALLLERTGAVLTGADEHPSVVTPWLARGFWVDVATSAGDAALTTEDYARAIRPNTKIIAVSHVRFNDGVVNDLQALAELARSAGAHLVVDATQSAGVLPIDVSCGIDILGFAGFKWLNAGDGSGALFVRTGLLERYGLPIAGNRSRSTDSLSQVERLEPLLEARAFELGTVGAPCALALGASLELVGRIGLPAIQRRVAQLTQSLRLGLLNLGFRTTGPDAMVSPIVSVYVDNGERSLRALERQGVHTCVRAGRIRLAVSWYNNETDMERCLLAFKELTPA
jgi:cysteine desulfurase/selenocysteine lyase